MNTNVNANVLPLFGLLLFIYILPELLALLRGEGPEGKSLPEDEPLIYRLLSPLQRFRRTAIGPSATERSNVQRQLEIAGLGHLSPESFWAKRVGTALVAMVLVGVLRLVLDQSWPFTILLLAAAVVLGYMLPWWDLRQKAETRKRRIYIEIPMFCVQVANQIMAKGVTVGAALRDVAREGRGEIHQEFRQAMTAIDLGAPREKALAEAAERCGVQALHDLVEMLQNAEEAGSGAVSVLLQEDRNVTTRLSFEIEAAKGRAVVQGTATAILFGIPAILVVFMLPALWRLLVDVMHIKF